MKVIHSWSNPAFKALRKQLKPGFGDRAIPVEGAKLIAEAIRGGLQPLGLWTNGEGEAPALDCPRYRVSPAHYQKASPTKSGHAPLALFEAPPLTEAGAPDLATGRFLLLDRLQDPGNAGALVRAAAAFAFDAVLWRRPCVYPFHHACIRASAGAALRVRQWLWDDRAASGLPLIGADAKGAHSVETFAWPQSLILAMGNEGGGLSPAIERRLDYSVRVPISARVESLNVAGAAHVMMHRIFHRSGQSPSNSCQA